jgi:hypothetical protein
MDGNGSKTNISTCPIFGGQKVIFLLDIQILLQLVAMLE